MVDNAVSLPSAAQPITLTPFHTRVEWTTNYTLSPPTGYQVLNRAIVERVTLKVGPEPATAVIHIPVAADTALTAGAREPFNHKVFRSASKFIGKELAPFSSPVEGFTLWAKVRIFQFFRDDADQIEKTKQGPRLFVGYVTGFEYYGEGKVATGFRVHLKDARILLQRTPVQGMVHFNPADTEGKGLQPGDTTGFIRDTELVFNEGLQPNMFFDPFNLGSTHLNPQFINVNHNRFIDDPGDDFTNRYYIHDGFLTDPAFKDKVARPHARKWQPGDVWNYIVNLIDDSKMLGVERIYDDPSTPVDGNELTPLRINTDDASSNKGEISIPKLANNGDDKTMNHDWFEPRSVIGATSQVGFATFVSPVGEFNPTGLPVNEVLFELCRLIGNYTLAVYYDSSDRMVMVPIRTVQGLRENKDLPVGLRGGRGGSATGKRLVLRMPTTKDSDEKPNIHTWLWKATADSYANRFHMKAGRRWVQVTFETVGRNQWRDQFGQFHQPYNTTAKVPAGEWLPQLTLPTLVPGWTEEDQFNFLVEYAVNGDTELFPDVFRTWIVPQDGPNSIDWEAFFDFSGEPGFRTFFKRDRQAQNLLFTSFFSETLGLFRNRRQRIPFLIARAYRGIPITTTGLTAYGGILTEQDPLEGQSDWFVSLADAEILTDGRLGFRLGLDARFSRGFHLEAQAALDPKPETNTQKTPWSWNGIFDPREDARSYEMLLTIPIVLDEDLWDQINVPNAGAANVNQEGPLLEMYRNASSEYGMEYAKHSLIARFNPGANQSRMLPIPKVDAVGDGDLSDHIYRDDRAEVRARTMMMANRHAVVDGEYKLQASMIKTSMTAGDYIAELEIPGDDSIEVNTIISAITHEFQQQQTTITLANIR